MSKKLNVFQLKVLAWIFEALLPPQKEHQENETNYYEVLEVSKKATQEEIRRAYKKKSLRYHPDKVAQKGLDQGMTREASVRRFQDIKEAYETLNDDEKRRIYDALGNIGVQILNNPSGVMDPSTVLDNLGKASCLNKSKLFFLVILFFGFILCLPILVCSKIDQNLEVAKGGNSDDLILANTKWVLILIPLWFLNTLVIAVLASAKAWVSLVSVVSIFVQEIFLALKWDQTISWDYAIIFIPLYFHHALKIFQAIFLIGKVRSDVRKMTTVKYLEKNHLNNDTENVGRRYEDLTDEEKDELSKKYIIVHVPPNASEDPLITDEETQLFMQIASSPEYQQRMDILDGCYHTLSTIILFRIAFMVLLVFKLDDNKHWDWFIVFVPIWIELAYNILPSCWMCCCSCLFSPGADFEIQQSTNVEDDLDEFHMEGPEMSSSAAQANENEETKTKRAPSPKKTKASNSKSEEVSESVDEPIKMKDDNISRASGSNYPEMSPLYATEDVNAPLRPKASEKKTPVVGNDEESDYTEDVPPEKDWSEPDEGEAKAMEKQAKAFSACCFHSILCMVLSLFLVKLNTADSYNKDEGTDPGYSAYWIAFPIFFFSGLTFCLCCCLIYSGVETDTFARKGDESAKEGDPNTVNPPTVETNTPTIKPTTNLATPKTDLSDMNHSAYYDDDLD